jgi:hypothetical protein
VPKPGSFLDSSTVRGRHCRHCSKPNSGDAISARRFEKKIAQKVTGKRKNTFQGHAKALQFLATGRA